MHRLLLVLCLTAAVAAGCGGGKRYHYSDEVIGSFTLACVNAAEHSGSIPSAAADFCQCAIDHLEQHVSIEEFTSIDARMRLGDHSLSAKVQKYLKSG